MRSIYQVHPRCTQISYQSDSPLLCDSVWASKLAIVTCKWAYCHNAPASPLLFLDNPSHAILKSPLFSEDDIFMNGSSFSGLVSYIIQDGKAYSYVSTSCPVSTSAQLSRNNTSKAVKMGLWQAWLGAACVRAVREWWYAYGGTFDTY